MKTACGRPPNPLAAPARAWQRQPVKELLRTNDAVLLTAVEAILNGETIAFFVADRHMSALEGSLGFLPRRVLVVDDEIDRARTALREAGLGKELGDNLGDELGAGRGRF